MGGVHFVLLGIGNRDRADDGAGVFVSGLLKHPSWLSLDCGTTPEAFTSRVRASGVRRAVLVDAVRMGLAPGEIRRIPPERVEDASLGSHNLPLNRVMGFLEDSAGVPCVFLGIQPLRVGPGEGLSPEIEASARRLAVMLADGSWERIPVLESA